MAKTGFQLPAELEARLRRFVPWGKKGKLIEGLLILAVEEAELIEESKLETQVSLVQMAIKAYHDAHK